MTRDTFQIFFDIVGPRLNKLYCVREPICAGERLALRIIFLVSGDSMRSISYAFRIAHTTVSKIMKETCNTLWDSLNKSQLLEPNVEPSLKIAVDLEERWQLPRCVGTIDGKHVVNQSPGKSGSTFCSYKGTHSIVILALLCEAHYRFSVVDIGGERRHSDGGLFKNSAMGKLINTNNTKFPAPSSIIGSEEEPVNYYIAADEACPLSTL